MVSARTSARRGNACGNMEAGFTVRPDSLTMCSAVSTPWRRQFNKGIFSMRFRHLVAPLSRLFRSSSPIAPSPQDKAAALDSGPPELIRATALGEGDASLRAAAILKLQDGEVLHKLAGLSGDASPPAPASLEPTALEHMAQKRMAQLLDAGTV